MTTKTLDEQIGNLVKLSSEQANQINTKLDEYLEAEKVVSKSALAVAILISKSGVISKKKIDTFKSISNTEILAFTKRFVIDGLGIADWNTYNPNRKEGLKRAMKIALGLIKTNAVGKDKIENGKISIRKNAVGENNPTKYDDSALAEMVNIPMNFNEAETWAKDVLTFVEKPNKKSKLAQAMKNLQIELENSWNEDMTKVTFKSDVRLEMNNTFNDLKDFIEQVKIQTLTPKDKIFQKHGIDKKVKVA